MESIFENLVPHPPVDVMTLVTELNADTFAGKIDLITGAFYTPDSKLWVSPLVKKVDKILAEDDASDYNYVFPYGVESFLRTATSLLMGEHNVPAEKTAHAIQSLGGSGALFLGLNFLMRSLKRTVVYKSDPSWDNYENVYQMTDYRDTRTYRYFDAVNRCVDFAGMCEDLNNAPEHAIIILQVCAHNPTGCDPTREQWMEISNIMKKRKLFPFFDCAYLGFASGDVDEDAWPVRYFARQGHELFCALSFSKTFALYGLRVGCLVIVNDKKRTGAIKSHFMTQIRGTHMTPPFTGVRIVDKVLSTPEYAREWRECVRARHERLVYLRRCLRECLEAKTRPGFWKCVTDQTGLFAYVGLPIDVVNVLKEKYHIYIPKMPLGRINIPSVTEKNVRYLADAIIETLTEFKLI